MVRLRILEILEEQNRTKYWLFKQMDLPNNQVVFYCLINTVA